MNKALENSIILITRPQPAAAALAQQLSQLGARPILFPTIEIIPDQLHSQQLAELNQQQIIIFVSAHAVRATLPIWPKPFPTATIIAVGGGTAKALLDYDVQAMVPEDQSSEGILQLAILQQINQQRIMLFCGANSRPLLSEQLSVRGAQVTEVVCYQRSIPNYDMNSELSHLRRSAINIIVTTSLETLVNLYQLIEPAAPNWLNEIPLIVISKAMAERAKYLGHKGVLIIAQNASHQAIIRCIIDLTRHC